MKRSFKFTIRNITAFVTVLLILFADLMPWVYADDQNDIPVWDGTEIAEPTDQDGVYQISTGAELAWFRDQVNSGTGAGYKAVLLDDIDLGGHLWQPIGSGSSHKYTGTFDGQGHEISGLYVDPGSNEQAGFFGYISAAEIKGVTLSGTVRASNSSAGGLISRAQGKAIISECGNKVDVTNTASSGKTAGIVGWADDNAEIRRCFNRGDISSGDRASGIIADTGTMVTVKDCYNTGAITGNKANGIGSATGISYENCYSAGTLSGVTSSYGIGASNYADYTNTYVLSGSASNKVTCDPAPSEMTLSEMKKKAFAENLGSSWKVDAGSAVNDGFPLLAWEKSEAAETEQLDTPHGLLWCKQSITDDEFDMFSDSYKVTWNEVSGANSYIVTLYKEGSSEPAFVSEETEKCEYDFFDYFKGAGQTSSAEYNFSVTAIGDGISYEDSEESQKDSEGYFFDSRAFIDAPSELRWNEASKIAVWKAVPEADFYIVTLYKGEKEIVETKLDRKVIGDNTGNLSAYFLNNITGSGEYYFTVRAGKTIDDADSPNNGKTVGSALASSEVMNNEEAQGDAIAITSAAQWIDIVNMEAAGTEYMTDADRQKVEWSKNYVLENDIDFSGLDTEQQSKTKSWGNIDAPFSGTFDGQGHKIIGLTLSDGDAGLFNYIGKGATVKNVTVENANLLVSDNAAVFAHYNYGRMQNCHVLNTNITTDYAGVIGPMASRNFGTIEACTVQGGKLTARTNTSNGHSGFVGNNSGSVKRCWTSMDVRTESYNAGGFAGWSDEQYVTSEDGETVTKVYGSFEDCFAIGDVYAARGWSGGFIGRINSTGNTFTNCYAAGEVTSTERPNRSYGFVGSYGSEGLADINGTDPAFIIDPPAENFVNCFYLSDKTLQDNPKERTQGKTLEEMQSDSFRSTLGLAWIRSSGRNSGMPYLADLPCPEETETSEMTVSIAIALYDRTSYEFIRDGEVLSVTLATSGNTCVTDVMDAAANQGLMTYEYKITAAYGSFIESINGNALSQPDGWMFTLNDTLSNVSASIAKVEDGDQILWYQGTTQNLFAPPLWEDITGEKPKIEWIDIESADDLAALSASDADLSGNYRLTRDIDMEGVEFDGIGSYGHEFCGTFSGNGHTVRNVVINRPEDHNIGFFNFVRGSVIKDLTLENVDITGKYSVGGFIGVADAEVNVQDRTKSIGNNIGNCHVSGKVTSVNEDQSATSDGSYAGGFIGFNNGDINDKTKISVMSSVDRCSANVKVSAGSFYSGGFAGGNYGYITGSSAEGEVEGTRFTGGFAGGNEGGVYSSSATGDVIGREYTGGFIGTTNGTIWHCYSTGDVSGTGEKVGGFIGAGSSSIKECASAGTVSTPSSCEYTGGFAGHYEGTYAGMEYQITFSDNHGWCNSGSGVLFAVGNKKSSTSEAEQSVLDSARVTEWVNLQNVFSRLFGVVLTENGDIVMPKREVDLAALAETLYGSLDDGGDITDQTPWILADIIQYERLTGKSGGITASRKQQFIDHVAAKVQEMSAQGKLTATSGDLAKYIIAMKALGLDPDELRYQGEDPEDTVSIVSMLRNRMDADSFRKEGLFTQPYILIALSLDPGYASQDKINSMIDVILSEQLPEGGFGSADAAGPVVMALSMHMGREDVRDAIENSLSADSITGAMDTSGAMTYNGEATVESTAQMLTALSAAGKDIEAYMKKDATLMDGLSAFVNESEDGFYHNYNKTGNPVIANEQGFRGLIALAAVEQGGVILYDYRDVPVSPAVSTVEREKSFERVLEETREGAVKALEDAMALKNIPEEIAAEIDRIAGKAKADIEKSTDLDAIPDIVRNALTDVDAALGRWEQEEADRKEQQKIEDELGRFIDLIILREDLSMKTASLSVTGSVKKKSATLRWKKIPQASSYTVSYRKSGSSKWKTIKTAGLACKLTGLAKSDIYEVRVKAGGRKYGESVEGAWSGLKYLFMGDSRATKIKPGRKKLTVKYSKASKATGYRIEYSLKKNMKGSKVKVVTGQRKTKVTIKGLKKGKRYFVRVIPIKKYKGRTYTGLPGKVKRTGKVR